MAASICPSKPRRLTVLEAGTMPEIFNGQLGPHDSSCFLYGRHFNPTVYVLGRQLAAMGGQRVLYRQVLAPPRFAWFARPRPRHRVGYPVGLGRCLLSFSKKCGITTTFVDMAETAIRAAVRSNTKVVYTDLKQPTLRVAASRCWQNCPKSLRSSS